MSLELSLRLIAPALLALAVAFGMDRMCEARGLLPPGFREPWRRSLAAALVALVLWIGAFASLGSAGQGVEPDLSQLTTPQLFLLHGLLVLTLVCWFLLGFGGVRPSPPSPLPLPRARPPRERGATALPEYSESDNEGYLAVPPSPGEGVLGGAGEGGQGSEGLFRQFLAQFGFVAPNVPREIGIGLLLGIGAWGAVLIAALAVGLVIYSIAGEDALPKQPPALIPWIAALPIGVRLLISLSAGVVEETFFRGFLQPRIGIFFSTLLFVAAHFSYGQPFMLVGIATLSLIYAFLVRWRQNIWPAMAAHALFDSVQLLVVIPAALEMLDKQGGRAASSILGALGMGN
ncbi:MAG TPA: CPBP family intramembrane glutamic endopeptidase [Thermoanaerobaculia bacterium]|nr:CPBP family intramembrane glutamic endopeptidase [Thermoanaerobaculia bacterium]